MRRKTTPLLLPSTVIYAKARDEEGRRRLTRRVDKVLNEHDTAKDEQLEEKIPMLKYAFPRCVSLLSSSLSFSLRLNWGREKGETR